MSKVVVYEVDVMFGDCDPAGIVFFPNFSKWMDASSLNFFVKCGVPPWRELKKTRGIVGTPLLEIHTKFMRPATYGERLQIHTSVTEWREKVCEAWRRRVVRRHRNARLRDPPARSARAHQGHSRARGHQGTLHLSPVFAALSHPPRRRHP